MLCVASILLLMLTMSGVAQEPIIHVRADSLATVNQDGRVPEIRSVVGDAVFSADTAYTAPQFVEDAVNGRPALRFANDGYLAGPSVYPTNSDYTLYVVARWDGQAASNNPVSGMSHALYLGNSPIPRLLHGGNFGQQAISTIAMDGPTVIRVTYEHTTGMASIGLNNAIGDRAPIPANTDPTLFIGSYARGNFFWGDIAEVMIYDQLLDSLEQATIEEELHTRYGIQRQPDPPKPVVRWDAAPRNGHFVVEGGSLVLHGEIVDAAVERVDVILDSVGIEVDRWSVESASSDQIDIERTVYPGLHEYAITATATLAEGATREVLRADRIVCGIAFAIEGQSNSIFGDVSQAPSPFARTFGSNNGRVAGDTTFKLSVANGNGGGANVGAWGLRLQNLLASELGMPSCVINGGVGGTRIQLHFPNEANRQSLSTIYGSWLYRLEKSGLREHIRWLFWYQGESNSGGDGYAALFDTLYTAWKQDLPNLEHVVVIQIRPGCGGTEHALLRDDQRRLQDIYNDVIVHTACALPGHDGCHFQSTGYRLLGDQLFRIYRDVEEGVETSVAQAPTVHRVRSDVGTGDVTITMRYAESILVTEDQARPLTSAFFFNSDESLHPDSVWIEGTTVILRPPATTSPTTVSYVPSKNDASTNALYQGPWLTDEIGVGALTFHDLPVIPSSVKEDRAWQPSSGQTLRRGELITRNPNVQRVILTGVRGGVIPVDRSPNGYLVPNEISPGAYAVVIETDHGVQRRVILVTGS